MPDRMIFVGQASLRRAVTEYIEHYHGERNHQGLSNRLIREALPMRGVSNATRGSAECSISTTAALRENNLPSSWTIRSGGCLVEGRGA